MKIIVCDDEPLMLGMLDDAIRKADASAEMYLWHFWIFRCLK